MTNRSQEYAGTIVTRSSSSYVDAFSMSGYRCFEDVVSALRDRARYSTLLHFTGICITRDGEYGRGQSATVEALEYDESELSELIAEQQKPRNNYMPNFATLTCGPNVVCVDRSDEHGHFRVYLLDLHHPRKLPDGAEDATFHDAEEALTFAGAVAAQLYWDDEADGAPWCQYCGAKRKRDCHCGPIADNH